MCVYGKLRESTTSVWTVCIIFSVIFFESYKLYKLQIRVRTDLWLQILRGDSLFSILGQNKVSFAISLPSTW